MNPFQDALIEADKDNFSYLKARYLDKSQIVQADDYLQVSANFYNNKYKRLSIAPNFIDVMMKHPTFNRTISGYNSLVTGAYFAAGQLHDADKTLYDPIYTLTIKPDKHTVVIYNGRNTFFIKIFNLAHFDRSRYRTLIQALVDCEVFVHHAKVPNPTPKHVRDSMRLILKRDFKLNAYEWGLTFNPEISRILLPVIEREAIVNIDGCYYLKNGKRIQCKIKVYNVSALAEGRLGKPYKYIVGDLMKFEVTFTHEFFIHHYAEISKFNSQDDIFRLLLDDILKQFTQNMFNKLTKFEERSLLQVTGTKSKGELMQKLSTPESLQIHLDNDLLNLKNQLHALQTVIEENTAAKYANTAAVHANTAAVDNLALVMMANTAANHANFLSDSSAFIKQQFVDKRKLRVVK